VRKQANIYDRLVAVRLTEEQYTEVRRQADIRGWSFSEVMRKALDQWARDEWRLETLRGAVKEGGLPERVRELLR